MIVVIMTFVTMPGVVCSPSYVSCVSWADVHPRRGTLFHIDYILNAILNRIYHSCKEFELFRQILIIITQLSVCSAFLPVLTLGPSLTSLTDLLTLRTWALYERNRRVLAVMVSVGLVLFSLSVVCRGTWVACYHHL